MGNSVSSYIKKERENPLCVILNIYELNNTDTLRFVNHYVIANYTSQYHRFTHQESTSLNQSSILFRFVNEDDYTTKKYKLRLKEKIMAKFSSVG